LQINKFEYKFHTESVMSNNVDKPLEINDKVLW